jgi:hypothetical protein
MRLKESSVDLLQEDCFDDSDVNPYFIFDIYESNLEDIDITVRVETELLYIIINEEYFGSTRKDSNLVHSESIKIRKTKRSQPSWVWLE